MTKRRILVSGASIAGLTVGYWLNHYGFDTTIIERCDKLRLGGQNIDVKGPAIQIIKWMGLEDKIRAANTTEVGIQFVNINNKVLAEFSKNDALSMTQELEILRGDLVEILFELVKNNTQFKFGDHITGIVHNDEFAEVSFKNSKTENFDVVIIAEGIGSATRKMVFGNEIRFNYLGLYTSYFTVSKTDTDTRWARWCNSVNGIVFLLRPDNHGTTRVCINFRSPERGYENLPINEQKELLISKISNVGWEAPRLIEGIRKADDFYLERLSQVKAPRWFRDKTAMIGDAAYCVTPIGGKGTDLAIAGAYIIATELAANKDYQKAFTTYERRLRAYVNKVQKLPPGVPGLVYPRSKFGVAILNTVFKIVGSKSTKALMKVFGKRKQVPENDLKLPVLTQNK